MLHVPKCGSIHSSALSGYRPYVFQTVKNGNTFGQKLLETYEAVGQFWDFTPEQMKHFPIGKMKGKWVGMTKEKLGQLLKG